MSFIALLTWISAGALGLYLLAIWLIEYDKDFQTAAATRLPPAVLTAHVLFAGGGMLVWIAYLIYDLDDLAWASVLALVVAAALGLTMAIRWLSVYQSKRVAERAAAAFLAAPVAGGASPFGAHGGNGRLVTGRDIGPPERNFPLPVVVAHGAFAVTTLALVLLTTIGVFGS